MWFSHVQFIFFFSFYWTRLIEHQLESNPSKRILSQCWKTQFILKRFEKNNFHFPQAVMSLLHQFLFCYAENYPHFERKAKTSFTKVGEHPGSYNRRMVGRNLYFKRNYLLPGMPNCFLLQYCLQDEFGTFNIMVFPLRTYLVKPNLKVHIFKMQIKNNTKLLFL